MTARFPADIKGLVDLARGTPWERVVADEAALEQVLVKEMAASADPLTKEIGAGLADGSMTWRTVASTSAYAEFVGRGLDALRSYDFEQLANALADGGVEEADEEDPDEPLWQGFGGHR
ncbi:hypothetical protein GCM10023148_34550 [Actinokineospora soli]